MATCVETGEPFVGTELTGVRTDGTFAQIGVIFAKTSGNYIRLFRRKATGRPVNFVEISGMTSEGCGLIVVTSGMIVVTFDATAEGKFLSGPLGEGCANGGQRVL